VSASAAPPWQQYICRVCGLVYDERTGDADSGLAAGTRWGDIPDDWACPICGVGKADFELYVPEPAQAGRRAAAGVPVASVRTGPHSRVNAGVLIVGAGRAGWAVAQALREQGCTQPITLVSACAGDVYDKPQLSVAVARRLDPERLVRESAAAAAARLNVQLRCGTQAVAIDATARRLRTTRGTLRYRHLVLAQGAEPALPAVLPAALVWRVNDLASYQRLRAALATGAQDVAIVGAGLVGCELANDLALAGHRITLIDLQTRPLAAQLPALASARLLQAWQALPIDFLGGVQVSGVSRNTAGPTPLHVSLKDGTVLAVHQVIAATGLRAAGRLAASAGLAYDSAAGGIVVDGATGATSVAGIHALGDCVVEGGQASRYIEPIARQARGIAAHIVGHSGSGDAAVTMAASTPLLRVKTSSLPITVTGVQQPGGRWQTEADTDDELRMVRVGAQGERLATLVARHAAR
jgi:rubredoxin---NAD+ reductase